jgi:hypothetical protein
MALSALLLGMGCKKAENAIKSGSKDSTSPAASAGESQPVSLRVKWPVGGRYTHRIEMNADSQTTMPQSPKPMAQKVNMNQEYTVTVLGERPKGGRELELEFDATEIDVTMNGKPVLNLDTKAEAGPAETKNAAISGFRQLVGTKIKILTDESNRVEKVEGMQEFAAKASAGSNPQGRAMMQGVFNEDYFKQLVDFQRGLPPGPVKPGDTWPVKTDLTVPVMGALTMDLNYTFKGWEPRDKRNCAALEFTGTMTSKGGASAGATGMSMKLESGKLSGKSWFDPDLGHPIETMLDQDMLMHMVVPVPRSRANTNTAVQTPVSQNITNNTRQNIVIKLIDLSGAK